MWLVMAILLATGFHPVVLIGRVMTTILDSSTTIVPASSMILGHAMMTAVVEMIVAANRTTVIVTSGVTIVMIRAVVMEVAIKLDGMMTIFLVIVMTGTDEMVVGASMTDNLLPMLIPHARFAIFMGTPLGTIGSAMVITPAVMEIVETTMETKVSILLKLTQTSTMTLALLTTSLEWTRSCLHHRGRKYAH
jgi:hypothetical protein